MRCLEKKLTNKQQSIRDKKNNNIDSTFMLALLLVYVMEHVKISTFDKRKKNHFLNEPVGQTGVQGLEEICSPNSCFFMSVSNFRMRMQVSSQR